MKNFYPRSPCGERPNEASTTANKALFLSTLSLRRATVIHCLYTAICCISIHALLAESDCAGPYTPVPISIFLSTLSLRRATAFAFGTASDVVYFYPRSPCGERQLQPEIQCSGRYNFYPRSPCGERLWPGLLARPFFLISIHALLAESDSKPRRLKSRRCVFLSTLSLRRATSKRSPPMCIIRHFYPRSPCGERRRQRPAGPDCQDFYPRSPCGERHTTWLPAARQKVFLSTLSLRRATKYLTGSKIHHPDFYPRSPCGERRAGCGDVTFGQQISIHALLAESD